MTTIAIPSSPTTVTRRPATYEEYLAQASETRIAEWVDGEMIEHMPPSIEHQDLTGFLYRLTAAFVSEVGFGKVVIAPSEVKLWPDGPSREPDLFVVRKDRLDRFDQWRFNGAPISGAASASTFSLAAVQLTNAGNYDVVITNQTGSSATSQVAVLTVGAGNFLKHRWSFTTDTTDSVGGASSEATSRARMVTEPASRFTTAPTNPSGDKAAADPLVGPSNT